MKYLLAAFLVLGNFVASAQYSFNGIIVDETGKPLPSVNILAENGKSILYSDSLGKFSIHGSFKILTVYLSHVGFLSQKIILQNSVPQKIVLRFNAATMEEAVVQAFEQNALNKNAAVSVGAIQQYQINRLGAETLLPSVNNIPGVKMDERSPGSYRLGIRGNLLRSTFGIRNVKIYWNGMPFTDASGNTNLNAVAPSVISSLEIIKGPSGSMYGAGTGGVVLLKSGVPSLADSNLATVSAAAGSYGSFSANAGLTLSKKNTTTFSFSHQQAGGYRNHSAMKRDVFLYTGNYSLAANRKLNSIVYLSKLFYETPGGLTAAEQSANPRQARPAAGAFQGAETQKASINLKTIYAALMHEWAINRYFKNLTGLFGSYTDFVNPTIRNYEDKYDRGVGARTVFLYNRKSFSGVFGAELQQGFFNASVFGNNAGSKSNLQFRDKIHSYRTNIFVQSGYRFKANWQLLAGLSYHYFSLGFERVTSSPKQKDETNFSPQWVPRVSVMKIWKPLTLYASLSKGYSPPGIDEVHAGDDRFNKSLQAEKSLNYETGFKASLFQNKLWIHSSVYFFRLKNTIVGRRDSSGGDFYINAGSTKQTGFETTIGFQPLLNAFSKFKSILITVNHNHIKARFTDYQQGITRYDGNKITGTVPNVFTANADFVFSNNIYLNCTYSFTDKMPLNDANTEFAPAYHLWITKIGYSCKINYAHADFFIAMNKSMNNPYSLGNDLNAAGKRFFNPSAPFMLNAGVKLNFGLK